MEPKMFEKGDEFRLQNKMTDELCLKMDEIKLSKDVYELSALEKDILAKGKHEGQGKGLTDAKQQKNKK
jgi:hypothetical protein